MRFERVDSTSLLVATEPYANTDEGTVSLLGRLLHLFELTRDMGEVLKNFTSLSLDSNFPCIDSALYCSSKKYD